MALSGSEGGWDVEGKSLQLKISPAPTGLGGVGHMAKNVTFPKLNFIEIVDIIFDNAHWYWI